ncbi:MAG: TIGR01212 family radical SAM protein [Spirochaetia bacterium]
MTDIPFNAYSRYLVETYGEKTYRIGVDGGFSCPNRGTDRREGGCTFCDESGARAAYLNGIDTADLHRQIERSRSFMERRYGARRFILYFQAYSGTYAPVDRLQDTYDAGLSQAEFEELVVSTRPDCVNEEVAGLLGSYRQRLNDVWVELGLQTAHDATLRRVRRGHDVAAFDHALELLRAKGVRVAAHVMFGLPGEGWAEIEETIRFLAERAIDGIKIHNVHVVEGTPLHEEYRAGGFEVPSAEEHMRSVAAALELLPRETVVMRLTCDTPDEQLVAPRAFWNKQTFRNQLVEYMSRNGMYQGRLCKETPQCR